MIQAQATREVFWNIDHTWALYALLVPAVVIAAYGFYRRIRVWRRGLPLNRLDRKGERVALLLRHALAQGRTVRDSYAGVFHSLIYTGFIVLAIATQSF